MSPRPSRALQDRAVARSPIAGTSPRPSRRAGIVVFAAIAATSLFPRVAGAADPAIVDLEPPAHAVAPRSATASLGWKLDAPLVAAGVTCYLVGRNLATERETVPVEGLESSDIRLDLDRRTIGHDAVGAGDASDWLRNASLAYPFALRAISGGNREGLRSSLGMGLLYVESVALAEGITSILKRTVSRPRPYTYMSDSDRPEEYDVSKSGAFQSFPSGHATAAWAAVSAGIIDHLRSRPGADWKEHAAVGLIGGVLGTATSSLRVEAGQHFPSDVAAGAAIGIASSATVSFLHHYMAEEGRAPWPPRRSWLAALAGVAGGVGIGLVTAEALDR